MYQELTTLLRPYDCCRAVIHICCFRGRYEYRKIASLVDCCLLSQACQSGKRNLHHRHEDDIDSAVEHRTRVDQFMPGITTGDLDEFIPSSAYDVQLMSDGRV